MFSQSDVIMKSRARDIASQHIQVHLEAYFKIKKVNGEQEKESIVCVKVGYKHRPASLVMPNSYTLDGFFPTLTLMMSSYSIYLV